MEGRPYRPSIRGANQTIEEAAGTVCFCGLVR